MALPELVRRRALAVAALAGVLVGAVAGLFLPIRAAAPPKSDEAPWTLPSALETRRFRIDQFQTVRSARYWGDLQQLGQRAAPAAQWTLAAIVTQPRLRVAVSESDKGKKSVWVGIGEALPDGATLVAANRDSIWFEKDGCRRLRKLYQKPTAESDACIGAPAKPALAPSSGKPAVVPAKPSPAAPVARGPN